mmetsp:Transcript_50577/g.117436  ORF Transcript_50577/g.117436 Transcript_50577/m.117436 type:complete len:192 (+) Transcript_50577:24-599(+)
MPKYAEEDFSLGITGLLDELLAERDEEAERPPPLGPEGDALARTFRRTADLCQKVEAHWAAPQLGDEGKERAEAVRRDLRADRGLGLPETLGSTGGSLTAALRANDLRLAQLRAELEELKLRCDSALGGAAVPCEVRQELVGKELAGTEASCLPDLEELLTECDAARAQNSEWKGLQQTPPGWRRLDRNEL